MKDLNIAILAEEEEDDKKRLELDYFWCIDPLDGTLPFIEGKAGYAVSIGLVSKSGIPQIGVVYDPYHQTLYQATKGQGIKINGHSWKLNSSEDQLTFTYDRSFADHREFSEILDELELYAQSIGLKGLNSYQYGGAVLNACNALEKSPGCHFKLPKLKMEEAVFGTMPPQHVCTKNQEQLFVMSLENLLNSIDLIPLS